MNNVEAALREASGIFELEKMKYQDELERKEATAAEGTAVATSTAQASDSTAKRDSLQMNRLILDRIK